MSLPTTLASTQSARIRSILMKRPKLKAVDLPSIAEAIKVATTIADLSSNLAEQMRVAREDAEQQVEGYRVKLQKHLDSKDIRPHVLIKPLPKNNWAIAFNSVTYSLGPYANFDIIDPDEPRFWWSGPDNVIHPAVSMFQAMLGILQDYCNAPPVER